MNLSTINVTHSIESLSSSSSPELLNTNTMLTTNHYTINSNLPSIIQTNSKLNGNELKLNSNLYHPPPPPPPAPPQPPQPPSSHQDHHHRPQQQQQQQHHYHSNYQQENYEVTSTSSSSSSSSSSASLALSSTSTCNGIISMNHLTNSLLYPFSSNLLLQESFIHLIYSTCFNIFDKRLNDELNKFNEKYELLFNEYNETKYRLNKLETIIQYHNKMNIPLIPLPSSSSSSFLLPSSLTSSSSSSSDYLLTSLNSLKSQHFNESIIDNNNHNNHNSHMMNTLKEIDTKWLMNWKHNNEDYLSSINSSKNNLLAPMLTTTTTTATTTRLDEQQQSIQRIKDQIKDNHPIEFDINHLSNSFIDSSMNENNVNYPKHLFHESNISRLHNHFYNFNNVIPSSSSSSSAGGTAAAAAAASSALSINNQHLLWNQWMVNCINSVNGLLLSSSTSSSSLSSQSILNNCEKINPFTMSDMDTIEGNQHKSSRLYSPMFLSSSEYTSNDLLNSNRKSSTLSSSTSPTTMPTSSSSSSSSIRFRGNKFGRLKTKCLNLNRYQQNYSLSNNRLHLCNKPNHFNSIMTTSALKAIRRSTINLPNTHWPNLSLGSQITTTTPPSSSSSSPAFTSIIDQKLKSNFLTDLQFPETNINNTNGLLSSSASNLRGNHHHQHNNNNNPNNTNNNLIDRPVVVLNPDEPREIFIGGVQSVTLPLWAYCKCLTMVRGEPHELGPRLCLRLLQSLFSLHYLVTHNYNGSGGKAPIDPIVMSAVLRQAQLQFGSGYFFTEPMALGKLRDYLNNAFRVMAFRQRKGERVRSPFWNEKGEPIHDLEAPVEFSNITDIIVIPHSINTTTTTNTTPNTNTTTVITATPTLSTTTTMSNESDRNMNSR